ncbi:hypothetical protein BJ508DRAFT_411767 [Ascobolus immersus RN42]|uniref:Uncharacterized protein n=1 Tax=Ascobolus immersus RN42 TaxID=1160509 RepID=A0A3N4INS0_ASCIM|nr:hypothetical protein BJ508DRAFT_411767 [Ascobolus immersus RN42]
MSESNNQPTPTSTSKGKGKARESGASVSSTAASIASSIVNSATSLAKSVLDPTAATQNLSESRASRTASGTSKGQSSAQHTSSNGEGRSEATEAWSGTVDGSTDTTNFGRPSSSGGFRTSPNTTAQSEFDQFAAQQNTVGGMMGMGAPTDSSTLAADFHYHPGQFRVDPPLPQARTVSPPVGPLPTSTWKSAQERQAYLKTHYQEAHQTPATRPDGADVLDLLVSSEDPTATTTQDEVNADDLKEPVPNPLPEQQELPDLNHPDIAAFIRCDDIVEFLSMRPAEDWGYSEEVWGDAVGLVREAREEVKEIELERDLGMETHQEEMKALARLRMLQGHLRSKL